jgi:hypothetical protein
MPTWVEPCTPTWVKPIVPMRIKPIVPTWVNPSPLTKRRKPLRALGFGEREARIALRQSATHVGENAQLEQLLRHAIGLLTARAWAKAS